MLDVLKKLHHFPKTRGKPPSHISVFCWLFIGLVVIAPYSGSGSCVRYVGKEASGGKEGMLSDEGQEGTATCWVSCL